MSHHPENQSSLVQEQSRRTIAATLFWVFVVAFPVIGIIISLVAPLSFYESQADFRAFVESFGLWAPIVFVLLQVCQVVIAPISHYLVGLMGGFLFGVGWGTFLNYIGRLLGHIVAFSIARKFGTPLLTRLVPEATLKKYDRLVSGRGDALFLMYFLPIFPDDELSYLAGLSKMPWRVFLVSNVFGHLGGSASLAYLGNGVDTKDALFWFLFLSTLIGFGVFWLRERRRKPTSNASR